MKREDFVQLELPDAAAKLATLSPEQAADWRQAYLEANQVDLIEPKPFHAVPDPDDRTLPLVTIDHVPGRPTVEALGIVTATAVLGADVFKDFGAGVANFIGGRAGGYEQSASFAAREALSSINLQAVTLGADAIVGVRVDYSTLGVSNGMLMASASGTAVRLGPDPTE